MKRGSTAESLGSTTESLGSTVQHPQRSKHTPCNVGHCSVPIHHKTSPDESELRVIETPKSPPIFTILCRAFLEPVSSQSVVYVPLLVDPPLLSSATTFFALFMYFPVLRKLCLLADMHTLVCLNRFVQNLCTSSLVMESPIFFLSA